MIEPVTHRPPHDGAWLDSGWYRHTADCLEKLCKRCREYWPADTEFFFRSQRAPDRLHVWCKACVRESLAVKRGALA